MDGRAHQRPLDDAAALERTGQLVALEAFDARPEADVHRRRVLRLNPADPVEGLGNGRLRAFEEQLPSQEGAVQLAFGEHTLAHGAKIAAACSTMWGSVPRTARRPSSSTRRC